MLKTPKCKDDSIYVALVDLRLVWKLGILRELKRRKLLTLYSGSIQLINTTDLTFFSEADSRTHPL